MGISNGVIEINDDLKSNPEQVNGTVTTAGTPVNVTHSSGTIQLALIKNPSRGPNANSSNAVLLINIDGNVSPQYISLNRGESFYFAGNFSTLKVNATVNGTKFEAVVWG